MTRILVLGLGDILNCDRGLGIYALRDLKSEGWPETVIFADELNLKSRNFFLQGFNYLLVLTIIENGGPPGTIYRFTTEDLLTNKHCLREPVLCKTLSMAEFLGERLEVLFFGLQPKRLDWDLNLSNPICEAYPSYLCSVRQELRSILYH